MPACGNAGGNVGSRNELACLKRVVADMERAMPRDKQQQRNYRGGKGSGKGTRGHASDTPCGCCGKTGHIKAECHHLGKDCNICGRTGHMAQICKRAGDPALSQRQQEQQQPKPKGQATQVSADKMDYATATKLQEDPWVCPVCLSMNYDPKKCSRGFCHGKRPQPEKGQPDTQTFIKLQFLQPSESTVTAACEEPDEDAEMADAAADSEKASLQQFITYGNTFGYCVKEAKEKLEALTPKLVSRIDQAKADKDVAAEKVRLLKNQEISKTNLTAKIEANKVKMLAVKEQQTTLIAKEMEDHTRKLEAINRDCAKMIESNQKEIEEALDKLNKLTERYEADYKLLDARMTVPAPMVQSPTPELPPQVQAQVAHTVPIVTTESMQALLASTGNNGATTENLAWLTSMVPLLNALLAGAKMPTPTVTEAPASNEEEEKLVAEAAAMNGALPLYAAGKPARHSDRVSPLQ
jgi:hypothetical protein